MRSIYDLSWNEVSFLAKLILFFKSLQREWGSILSEDTAKEVSGRLAFSSTCYSILGSTVAELKSLFRFPMIILLPLGLIWFLLIWLPLAVCCYGCLVILTNKLMSQEYYKSMTAEQCDVLQSILLRRGYIEEAGCCISYGLEKEPRKPHTHSLLFVGKANLYKERGKKFPCSCGQYEVECCVVEALRDIEEIEKDDPLQALRIYRKCAELTKNKEFSNKIDDKVKEISQKIKSKDQLAKI